MAEAITAESLMKEVNVDARRWNSLPSEKLLKEAAAALESRGIKAIMVADRKGALEKLAGVIPPGAEIMTGSSTTLLETGFMAALEKGMNGWKSVHKAITAENDAAKRAELRRKAVTSDYFVAGVNAVAATGELVACDASGSRVGAFHFAARNLVLVAGANKIVPTLDDAMARLREYVFPLENARAMKVYGSGSGMNKIAILAREMMPGRVTLILVREKLGY